MPSASISSSSSSNCSKSHGCQVSSLVCQHFLAPSFLPVLPNKAAIQPRGRIFDPKLRLDLLRVVTNSSQVFFGYCFTTVLVDMPPCATTAYTPALTEEHEADKYHGSGPNALYGFTVGTEYAEAGVKAQAHWKRLRHKV